MIVSPHAQRSPEWRIERLALPTASKFPEIVTTKGKPTSEERRLKYLDKLVGEYVTKRQHEWYSSKKMKEKAEREGESRELYELRNGVEVRQVGLCWKDEQKMFGASPDGLVDPNGGFETKDADPNVQVRRIRTGWNGMDHFQQCQGGMYICDREWWDLQSYCRGMRPIVIRFYRDEAFLKKLEAELMKFCFELAMTIKKIRRSHDWNKQNHSK